MKSKFLKIAGVKTEEDFYKKFPTKESFMAKYGKVLEKADPGITSPKFGSINTPSLKGASNIGINSNFQYTPLQLGKIDYSDIGINSNFQYNPLQLGEIDYSGIGVNPDVNSKKSGIKLKDVLSGIAPNIDAIAGAISDIKENKRTLKQSKQYATISGLAAQANASGEKPTRRYVRPEDNLVTNINPYGNGTNYLAAKDGKKLKKGEFGLDAFSGISGDLGGLLASKIQGGKTVGPGSKIGSSVLGTVGNLILPGVGGLIGSAVGGLAGGLIAGDGKIQKEIENNQNKIMNNSIAQQIGASLGNNSSFMEHGGKSKKYRTGGNLRNNELFDGDLQIHRGDAEVISENPYLPKQGETILFRGPSHDNGGMPISYGKNGVEVEGGEPAMVMENGGKDDNLVVFGNMKIPDYGASEIGDKKAKGVKFKTYIKDLSKKEARQNKIIDKSISLIDDADDRDPFEKLKMNSGKAMFQGSNMKLKDIAQKKLNTYAVQDAILETADEYNLKSNKLASSKLAKVAKFGGKFKNDFAKDGIVKDLTDMAPMVANPYGSFFYNNNQSEQFDDVDLDKLRANLSNFAPMLNNPYGQNFYRNEDLPELYTFDDDDDVNSGIEFSYTDKKDNNEIDPSEKLTDEDFRKGPSLEGMNRLSSIFGARGPMNMSSSNLFEKKPVQQKPAGIEDDSVYLNEPAVVRAKTLERSKPMGYPFPLDESRLKGLSLPEIPLPQPIPISKKAIRKSSKGDRPPFKFPEIDKNDLKDYLNLGANLAQPFLRQPFNQSLDYTQIAPELLAMSQNQIEPVNMQTYQPMLNQAQNYNYQDQLNEITAQSRAAERLAQSNPAAAAMLFSQVASAKNKVLAEQFRINQAEKQRIAEQNSQVLNDAQLKNLAMYDQQFVRQSEAKSRTKSQNIEISKSIADKIAKNKLNNLKQTVQQNLYPAFNFTRSGVAYKNPAFRQYFESLGVDVNDMIPNDESETDKSKSKSKNKNRNGGIVKAFKNF
jgi:hypothetical protein